MEALSYLFLMFKRFSALTEFELVLFHVISHACKTLLASPILNDIAELPQTFQKKRLLVLDTKNICHFSFGKFSSRLFGFLLTGRDSIS